MTLFTSRTIIFTTLALLITLYYLASFLLPCSSHTPTTAQTTFTLSRPQPVAYDFTSLSPHIKVTVPPDSHWRSDEHFHNTPETCASVLILSGNWVISGHGGGTTQCHAGFKYAQKPLWYLTWFKNRPSSQSASLRLTAPVQFYRTVCSVSQDSERYFYRCTTPLWLRSIYFGTFAIPIFGARLREWMIETALWIQLRVVYEANDFWTYEGEIPFEDFYIWPSDRETRWQIQSRYVISRMVVGSASWVGRWVLGMKDSYEEYEVREDQPRETFKS